MQERVAPVDDYQFDIEIALSKQLGAKPLPFIGMDKSQASLCEFYLRGSCVRGSICPYRHSRQGATIVCKHWIRHLCKKGDDCEYLHEYDMSKMPECHFFSKFGECHNKDCPYQHIDPESKIKDCFWYDRGYCKHGPGCRHRHVRRVMCVNYLTGFCPEGPRCKFKHPKFDIPMNAPFIDSARYQLVATQASGAPGAVSQPAPVPQDTPPTTILTVPTYNPNPMVQIVRPTGGVLKRPLEQVTCFKCGNKGHYANMCPNSYRSIMLATQSSQHQTSQTQEDTNHPQPIQSIETIGTTATAPM